MALTAALAPLLWAGHLAERDAILARAVAKIDLVATLAASETQRVAGAEVPTADHMAALGRNLPAVAFSSGRVAYLSDRSGLIVATSSPQARPPSTLDDLFGEAEPRSVVASGRVVDTVLADGTAAIATVRTLPAGHLTVVQPHSAMRADLRPQTNLPLALGLVGVAGFATLGLGCLRYRRRALMAGLDCTRLAARLDTSLARGRCGLWDWDIARRRVTWSASMYELLGYEPRDEHLSPGEVDAILFTETGSLVTLMDMIATGTAPGGQDLDLRARTASGGWLWLRAKVEIVRDPVDGATHIMGVATDVTEERRQTERRASADRRLRDAVETLSEAFVLWDADDRLILCNSKFLKLHELPPELAVPGTPYARVIEAGRRPVVEKQLNDGRPNEPGTRTIETQLFDGRWMHVNERRTKEGGVVSVATDVSGLKRAEARLQARERHLQGSVRAAQTEAQRYAALAERNFEANQAKTEFLARMSHELRTPLNAIIGFADMMRQEILGPIGCRRYSEYSRDIHRSGLKLLDVIDGILQMSRIEAGRIRLAPELMTIDAAIDRVVAALEPDAAKKGLAIETDLASPCLLQADGHALHELFTQLLRNAIKFTEPDGAIRVRVRASGPRIHVFVEDNGIGIAPEILPRLGRPFEQVEAEYSRAESGSGLGLAIARALAELHGGRLRIRSQPGIGTIVLVALPVVQPPANDLAADEDEAEQPRLQLVAAE